MTSRFWSDRSQSPPLDPAGFLRDHATLFDPSALSSLLRLDDCQDRPCLVLLGEPGMGKTTELREARERRSARSDLPEVAIVRDLGEYDDRSQIIGEVFAGDAWDRWSRGECDLRVELDALDECRLAVPQVAKILANQLARLANVERLKLRITCRTAVWQATLEEQLRRLWPDQVSVLQLAPLARREVLDFARAEGIADAESFLDQVERRGLGPLAAKPITLKLLVPTYRQHGQLPGTLAELYERGCRALCEESNPSRRDAGQFGDHDPDRRLAVAARIAGRMVFANRSAIRLDPGWGESADGEIALADLSGGVEPDGHGFNFAVGEPAVRKVLEDTALFVAHGSGRLAWSHRTFAEFLAALHIRRHGLDLKQVAGLILAPQAPRKVVPPLAETAAWLAGSDHAVFRLLLTIDPSILLQSDVAAATPADRAALVAALLEAAQAGRFVETGWGGWLRYRKLNHPELARQIEPLLHDRSAAFEARRLAVDLARECRVASVQGHLADVALDREEELSIREMTAHAVVIGDDPAIKLRLRRLLESGLEEDCNDELRGYALTALWPGNLNAADVFRYVTRLKRDSFFGSYKLFLHHHLVRGLTPSDLPFALGWVATKPIPVVPGDPWRELVEAIVRVGWDYLDRDNVARGVVAVVRDWFGECNGLWPLVDLRPDDAFWIDAAKRRTFIGLMIDQLEEAREPRDSLATRQFDVVIGDLQRHFTNVADGAWLIRLLDQAAEAKRGIVSVMLLRWYQWFQPSLLGEILEAAGRHPQFEAALLPLLQVELHSPAAEAARRYHQEKQAREALWAEASTHVPPPVQQILIFLGRSETGDPNAWWQLTHELTRTPTSRNYGDIYATDLRLLPAWRDADTQIRERII